MIERVEGIHAEQVIKVLLDVECATEGGVKIESVWPGQRVSTDVAEGAYRLPLECCRIDPLLRRLRFGISRGNLVGPIVALTRLGDVDAAVRDVQRRSTAPGDEAGKLPIPSQGSCDIGAKTRTLRHTGNIEKAGDILSAVAAIEAATVRIFPGCACHFTLHISID